LILDTNAVSALLGGDLGVSEVLVLADRHELPVVVIGEYRFGLLHSTHRDALEPLLEQLIRESTVLRIDSATALCYARVRSALRTAGTPIPENDVWISALAVQHSLPVVSRDAHFDRVDGVRRVGW